MKSPNVSWNQLWLLPGLINSKCHVLPNCIITVYNFDCSFAYENESCDMREFYFLLGLIINKNATLFT